MRIGFRTLQGAVLLLLLMPLSARGQQYLLQQSSELPVSTPVLSGPYGDAVHPAIAAGLEESLLVWLDYRTNKEWRVYGALLGSDGSLRQSALPIGASASREHPPAVAFNGTHFLVAWAGREPAAPTEWRIWGRRFSREGQPVDAAPFILASGEPSPRLRAAAVGDVWIVVFGVYGSDATRSDIWGVRVGPGGELRDTTPLPITQGAGDEDSFAVGSNGTNWLVTWQEGDSSVRCVLVPLMGPVTAAARTLSSSPAPGIDPDVASDGSQFLVVWNDEPDSAVWGLHGARVGADGSVMGSPFLISEGGLSAARVAYAGGQYLVTRHVGTNVSSSVGSIRVSTSGTVLDASPVILAEQQSALVRPVVAPAGAGFRVAWSQGLEVLSLPVGANGQPGPSRLLVNQTFNAQYAPAVAFDGTRFLLVWQDDRSGEGDIYGARLLPDGSSLDGAGFPINTRPGAQKLPAVTFDGTQFIVAWQDERSGNKDIFAARVKPDGTVVDPEGLPVASSPREELTPALASDGSGGVLATWHEVAGVDAEIRGARMAQGRFTALTNSISGSRAAAYTGMTRNLSVAYGAGSYLVAWSARGAGSQQAVWGAVLPSSGDSGPSALFAIGAAHSATRPAVAFSGTGFLVTWLAYDRGEVRARHVSSSGILEGQELLLRIAKGETRPSLAFDGNAFIVAWEKAGGGALEATAVSPLGVTGGLVEIAAEPFAGAVAGYTGSIALAGGPKGASLLAYSRFDEQLEHTVRVRASRLISFSAPPPDAGPGGPDGGMEEPGTPDSGCGCSSSSGTLLFGAVLLVWLATLNTRSAPGTARPRNRRER